MKNFRKVLALVLVVATLFSFTAMASAKSLSDYTDASSVNYGPAVDILSTLGILNGYEDDSFKPTNTITREEMAKMIAVLANSGSDVSSLYATACTFADVAKDHWSASYVAYCAKTGIVAGRSATTFDPKGKVTGLETAKMLLVTMGFDAEKQGYVGSDWKVNVLRDAKNCGLLGNFAASYDVDAAITREEAAQMMLNALNAQVVIGYVSNNILTITNTAYKKWDGTLIDATKLNSNNWAMYGNAIIAKSTLAEALYGTAFSKQAAHDCFGRPGYYWSFKNSKNLEASGTVFFAETVDYTSSTAVNFQNVLKNEKASSITYKTDVYVDGKLTDYASLTAAWDALKALAGQTGKGVQTEIYVNDAEGKITIVVINTYIGVVKYTTNKAGKFYVDHGQIELSASNKTYGFKKGDVILYWVCETHGLHEAALAETATGTVTRAEAVKGNYQNATATVGGKAYEYAFNFAKYAMNDFSDAPMNEAEVAASKLGTEYVLYLDKYGYIMAWETVEPATDYYYAYVVEYTGSKDFTGWNAAGKKTYACTRDMVDFVPEYKKDVAVTVDTWDETLCDMYGTLIEYTLAGEKVAMTAAATVADSDAVLLGNGNIVIDENKTIYGTADSKYMVRTWDYDKEELVYNVYSKKELPGTYKSANNMQYFASKIGNVDYVDYVFIDATYIAVAQNAFVVGYNKSVSDQKFVLQIGAYDAYDAVINGEPAILAVTKGDTVLKTAAEAAEAAGTTICNLYSVELQCIGLTDDNVPVYANVGTFVITTANRLRVVKGMLQYEKGGKWVAADIAEDAFAVVAFKGGYDFNADGAGEDYTIIDIAEKLNFFYEMIGANHPNADEAFQANCAAWVITNAAGEVTEVYYQVK